MKPSTISGIGGQQKRVVESQMQKFMAKPWLGSGSWLQLSGDWVLPTLECHFFVSASEDVVFLMPAFLLSV